MTRLIDANDLKGAIMKLPNDNSRYYYTGDLLDRERVLDEIDNAPTVEEIENEVNCILTMFGKCSYNKTGCSDCEIKDKIRKALNERPQGEWIEESSETGALGIKYTWVRCNQCDWSNSLIIPKNFCPNCGADMKRRMTDKISSKDFIKAFGNGVKDNREITQISKEKLPVPNCGGYALGWCKGCKNTNCPWRR